MRHALVEGFAALARGSRPQLRQPLCAPVAMDIFHLALDDFAEIARSVDQVPVARVDADVVPRLQLAVLVLVEEHEVAGPEASLLPLVLREERSLDALAGLAVP